jgi:hypothetical protein
MLIMPDPSFEMSFKCKMSAPINGPRMPTIKATGGACSGAKISAEVAAASAGTNPGTTMPKPGVGRAVRWQMAIAAGGLRA